MFTLFYLVDLQAVEEPRCSRPIRRVWSRECSLHRTVQAKAQVERIGRSFCPPVLLIAGKRRFNVNWTKSPISFVWWCRRWRFARRSKRTIRRAPTERRVWRRCRNSGRHSAWPGASHVLDRACRVCTSIPTVDSEPMMCGFSVLNKSRELGQLKCRAKIISGREDLNLSSDRTHRCRERQRPLILSFRHFSSPLRPYRRNLSPIFDR